MARTREEALKLGIKVRPIEHRMTRRASWNKYWKRGRYGITIHINEDENGDVERCLLLSEVVGTVTLPIGEGNTQEGNTQEGNTQEGNTQEGNSVTTELTELGRLVKARIDSMGTHRNDGDTKVTNMVIMPTHIHMTYEIEHDLPMHAVRGKMVQVTLSDIVRGFEKGCTSWYYRWVEGESVDEILANPTRRRESSAPPQLEDANGTLHHVPSLWQEGGFNDKVLNTEQKYINWNRYVDNNARFWKMQMDYPPL